MKALLSMCLFILPHFCANRGIVWRKYFLLCTVFRHAVFYFLSIFEVYTPEYREYVYVKKDCDVIDEILG